MAYIIRTRTEPPRYFKKWGVRMGYTFAKMPNWESLPHQAHTYRHKRDADADARRLQMRVGVEVVKR